MKHIEVVQGSPEWFQARLGKVTASRVADVMTRTKTGWGASRKNYMAELVAEQLTGQPAESYQNAAMKWGLDTEPAARAAYEFFRDAEVQQVGFIEHPTIEMAGASPDGLVGLDGMVEIKCPATATHIETLLGGAIESKYRAQMLFQMACADREWCDFVSFDPRMPAELQLHVQRVHRNTVLISEMELEVGTFLIELTTTVDRLLELRSKAEPPSILAAG